MRSALLIFMALLCGMAAASPPMPPPPRPVEPALAAAQGFAVDLVYARDLARKLAGEVYYRPEPPLPVATPPATYTYDMRRYADRNEYQILRTRTGNTFVSMQSDGYFPTLRDTSRIDRAVVVTLVPTLGTEAGLLHVILLHANGSADRSPAALGDAANGIVRFGDGEKFYNVVIPYDGGRIKVLRYEPPDRSF